MNHDDPDPGVPDLRALSPAGLRVMESAGRLFGERGITAVGVDLVAADSGVTKRTLYDQFGSKERLVAAYLAARDLRWREDVERAVLRAREEAGPDPVGAAAALLAPFAVLAAWPAERGCAFLNALAELPDPAHPGHRVAAASKRWLLELLTRLAAQAGTEDPSGLATRLLVLHEGVQVTRPLGNDTLATATELARSLVAAGLPQPSAGA